MTWYSLLYYTENMVLKMQVLNTLGYNEKQISLNSYLFFFISQYRPTKVHHITDVTISRVRLSCHTCRDLFLTAKRTLRGE